MRGKDKVHILLTIYSLFQNRAIATVPLMKMGIRKKRRAQICSRSVFQTTRLVDRRMQYLTKRNKMSTANILLFKLSK